MNGRTDRQGQILMPPDYRHGGIKKICWGGGGGGGGGRGARVSELFFIKNPILKKKFFLHAGRGWGEGGGGGGGGQSK